MKVAVIGAGNMGTGLARSLVAKHEVTVGSRDPEKAQSVARELGAAGGAGYADAVADAEVVFLAVPWPAVEDTLAQVGDLSGKVLVDITNPYVGGKLQLHENTSNAEEIQPRRSRRGPPGRMW